MRSLIGVTADRIRGFDTQIVLNMADARDLFRGKFRAAALNTIFDGTTQRNFRIVDIHLDLRSVDIGIVAQMVGDILANALVRTLVIFWPKAVITRVFVTDGAATCPGRPFGTLRQPARSLAP